MGPIPHPGLLGALEPEPEEGGCLEGTLPLGRLGGAFLIPEETDPCPPWTETVCKAQMIMRTARNKARKDIFDISAAALWACVGVTCVTVCAAL